MTLTDAAVLAFERRWYARPGSREQAILDEFGWTSNRYHQRLARIIEDPQALRLDAQTVRRLQRLRDARITRRTG